MDKLIHNPECSGKTETEASGIITLNYCLTCGCSSIEETECIHEYIPVAFVLSDGEKIQIRQYCKKCFSITPKSESHSKYDLSKLPRKSLELYRAFYDNEREKSIRNFDQLRQKLDLIKRDFNKDVYSDYLQSEHWKELRLQVLDRDRNTCQICGDKATEVHHLTYAHRDNEFLFELVSLCHNCHKTHY